MRVLMISCVALAAAGMTGCDSHTGTDALIGGGAGAARLNRTGLDGDPARADHADPT